MTGPLMLIVIGVLFLLNNLFPSFSFGKMWPVILIVIGVMKVLEFTRGAVSGSNTPRSGDDAKSGKEGM